MVVVIVCAHGLTIAHPAGKTPPPVPPPPRPPRTGPHAPPPPVILPAPLGAGPRPAPLAHPPLGAWQESDYSGNVAHRKHERPRSGGPGGAVVERFGVTTERRGRGRPDA